MNTEHSQKTRGRMNLSLKKNNLLHSNSSSNICEVRTISWVINTNFDKPNEEFQGRFNRLNELVWDLTTPQIPEIQVTSKISL